MTEETRNTELEKKIDAYIKGNLSNDEVKSLWVDLLRQPEYISLLKTEIDVTRLHQARQGSATQTDYWKWIGAAAAVVLLVISLNVFTDDAPQSIGAYTQGEIGLIENLSSSPVTRSATAVEPSDSLLNAGFKAALDGNTQAAINIYSSILQEYESNGIRSKAYLNLGILHYNSGDFALSIESFRNAIAKAGDDEILKERSYWYLGNALVNTNKFEKAREAVYQAYSRGEIYKPEAFRLLRRLDYELGNIDFDNFEQQINELE
jgi:tetratricopeptide (TPR) repeat protein